MAFQIVHEVPNNAPQNESDARAGCDKAAKHQQRMGTVATWAASTWFGAIGQHFLFENAPDLDKLCQNI
jgi:hypothetical protein